MLNPFDPMAPPQEPDDWKARVLGALSPSSSTPPAAMLDGEVGDWRAAVLEASSASKPAPKGRTLGDYGRSILGSYGVHAGRMGMGIGAAVGLGMGAAEERLDMMKEDLGRNIEGQTPLNPFRLSGTEEMFGRSLLRAGASGLGALANQIIGADPEQVSTLANTVMRTLPEDAPPLTEAQLRTADYIEGAMEPGAIAAERWKADVIQTQGFVDGGYKDPAYYANTLAGLVPDVTVSLTGAGLLGKGAGAAGRLAMSTAASIPGTLGAEVQEGTEHLMKQGKTREEAIYEATVSGLVSTFPQAALEGATDIKIIDQMKDAKALGRRMLGLGLSSGMEGTTEVLQAISSQAAGEAMGLKGPVEPGAFGKQLVDEFAGGALGGTVLGGGAMLLDKKAAPQQDTPTATNPDGTLPPNTVVLPTGRAAVVGALRASLAQAGQQAEGVVDPGNPGNEAQADVGDATPLTTQVLTQLQETVGPAQAQQVIQVLAMRAQGLGMPLERLLSQFPLQVGAMPAAGPQNFQPQAIQPETAPTPNTPPMEPISVTPPPAEPSAPRPAQDLVNLDEFAGQYPELTPVPAEQGNYMVATSELNTDPYLQYKVTHAGTGMPVQKDKSTATGSIEGLEYEPAFAGAISVWRNPEDGKLYVLNGNNRYALAKSQNVPFQKVRVAQAATKKEARAVAAWENIAERAGTIIDNATFFREEGVTAGDPRLKKLFGPSQQNQAEQGLALAKLDEDVFEAIAGRPDLWSNAVALGRAELTPQRQKALLGMMTDSNGNATKPGVWSEMVAEMKAAQFNAGSQSSLFSADELDSANANLRERATIIDAIKSKLAGTVATFQRIAGRTTQKALGEMKADVSPEQARTMAAQAQQVLEEFERSRYEGPINDLINSYATEMQGAKSAKARAEISARATEEITGMLAEGQQDSVGEGAVSLFDKADQPRATGAIAFGRDAAGNIASQIQIDLQDGRPVKPTTIFHEVWHYVRRTLTPSEKAWAERYYGVTEEGWTEAAEEKFARDGERWMRDGKFPDSAARSTWNKIRALFRETYQRIRGSSLRGTKLTPELESFFMRIMGDSRHMPTLTAPPPRTTRHPELLDYVTNQKKFRAELAAELKARGLSEDIGEHIALLDPEADADKLAQLAEAAGNVLQRMTGQELVEAYAAISDSYEGHVIDTDVMRQLNPFYLANPTHMSAIVHEVSSALTKRLLAHNLQREAVPPPGGGNAFTLVTAGGGGSGKGRFVLQEGIKAGADFVLDTTLSDPAKAIATVESILESGRDARVVFVYTPLSEATNNMIERATRGDMPRVVRLEAMAKAHDGAPRSIAALLNKFGQDKRVTIKMAFNGRDAQGRAMLDSTTAEGREAMRKELADIMWGSLEEANKEAQRAAQKVIESGWVGYDGVRGDVPKRVAEYLKGEIQPALLEVPKEPEVQAAEEPVLTQVVVGEPVDQGVQQLLPLVPEEPARAPEPELKSLFDEPNPVARKVRHFKSFYRQTGLSAPSVTQQQAGALARRLTALGLDPSYADRVWDNLGRWNRVVDRHAELKPVDTALRSYWNTQSSVIHQFLRLQEVYSGMSLNEREELGLVMDKGEHMDRVFDDATLAAEYGLNKKQIVAYHERLRYFQSIAREFSLSAKALAKTAIDQVKVRKDLTDDQKATTIKAIKQQLKALREKFNREAYVPAIRMGDKQVELWTPEMIKLEEDRKPYLEKLEKWRAQASEAQKAMERGDLSEPVGTKMLTKIDNEITKINEEMEAKGLDKNPYPTLYLRYDDEASLQRHIDMGARQYKMRTGDTLDISTLVPRNAQKLQVPGPLVGVDANFAEYLMEIAHMAVGTERASEFLANEFPGIVESEMRLYMAKRASKARTAGFAGRLMAKHGIMGNMMDAHRVDAHYAATVAREVAVRENKAKIEAAISGVTNPDLRRYASEHVGHAMSAPTPSEKIVQWIKGVTAFNNLAFKPMYALQQLAQQYTSERPIFQTMYARNRAQLDAAYALARALANPYALRRFKSMDRTMLDRDGHLPAPARREITTWFNEHRAMLPKAAKLDEFIERLELALAKAEAGGTFDNQVYADVWDAVTDTGMVDPGVARRVAKKLLSAGTYLSAPLEELNRRRTFMVDFIMRDAMAGVRPTGISRGTNEKKTIGLGLIASDNFAGVVLEAQRTVDRLHNAQGRRYYSRLEQKVGSFGALAMQFKAFAIDYGMGLWTAQQALYSDYLDNEVKAGKMTKAQAWRQSMKPATKSMATVMVLGGALGLPMMQHLVAAVASVFDDPEEDFLKDLERRAIKFLGGGEVAKRIVKSLMWGASNAAGYDIGSSFSMGELFFMPEQGSPAENVVALVLGASGDNMVRYWRAVESLKQGDTSRALSEGLPGFARFMKRGIEGKVEAMGEKQRLAGTDRLAHFLGIRSTDTADRYDIATAQKRLQKARQKILDQWGREMGDLLAARREADARGDVARAEIAQKKIDALREAFRGEMARFNTYSAELGAQDKFKLTLNSLTKNAMNKADDEAGTAVNRRTNRNMKRVWGIE